MDTQAKKFPYTFIVFAILLLTIVFTSASHGAVSSNLKQNEEKQFALTYVDRGYDRHYHRHGGRHHGHRAYWRQVSSQCCSKYCLFDRHGRIIKCITRCSNR